MNKKLIISLLVILCTIFCFTVCFANNENGLQKAADDVRNVVGGAENTIENAAMDISNVSKDVTGNLENDMNGKTNSNNNNNNDNNQKAGTRTNNSNYNTTRVSTNNVMGMSQNGWTWLIVGIAAIAIIAVIWYYSMQLNTTSKHYHDNNDDE